MSEIDELNKELDKLTFMRSRIVEADQDIKREEAVLLAPLKIRKAALDKLREDYEKLRDEVKFQLRVNHMEKWQNDKVTAYIKETPKVTVKDHLKIADWLKSNGFAPDEYAKPFEIDQARIAPLQIAKLREDGEIIDGMEFEMQEILTVRDRDTKTKEATRGKRTSKN